MVCDLKVSLGCRSENAANVFAGMPLILKGVSTVSISR